MQKQILNKLALLLSISLLAACDSMPSLPDLDDVVKDRSADYKSSRSLPPLEIPPDLSSSSINDQMRVPDSAPANGTATYSEYASDEQSAENNTGSGILVNPEGISIQRDGDKRWLVLEGTPEMYWDKVRSFWQKNGLLINFEDPKIGIMETDWAENRADIPEGWLRRTMGGLLDSIYSAATRDKYRVRFERGLKEGTTELFISHTGAEEVNQGETTVWQPRPADPELEAEMLNRLMVYLGVSQKRANTMLASSRSAQPRASLSTDQQGMLLILDEGFSRAWRRTGLALDRIGFTVEDRDRSRGVYFVRYADPSQSDKKEKGFLSKLAFWSSDEKIKAIEYLIKLDESVGKTKVKVLDKDGNRDTGSTPERILKLLFEQLK